MPRRGSNIYKRKDGRFEGRVAIGHKENGALRYKYVYAHTLSELKNKNAPVSNYGAEATDFCY